jgi:hypothetical protein
MVMGQRQYRLRSGGPCTDALFSLCFCASSADRGESLPFPESEGDFISLCCFVEN